MPGGKSSRDKGRRGELEFAKLIGGRRISREGDTGPDVEGLGRIWEVKRRKPGDLPRIYTFIREAKQRGGAGCLVAAREDRREWLVIMTYNDYLAEREAQNGTP